MNLTFSSNVRRIVVRVPILQDSAIEGTEHFRASLSLVEDMSAVLTVRILSGDLTLGAWAAVEFKTSNKPNSSNTSAAAMCKHYRTLI